jgi:putative phage-type endonuclease
MQGTDEWFAARLGKVTASRIVDVMAKGRSGEPSATRANYMAQLVCERLTGKPAESYSNAAMQHGTDTEPQARAMYELETGLTVEEVDFIPHPAIAMSGASPDGLVGSGLVEIKCPNTATHLKRLMGEKIDRGHVLQMQWQMACTGRVWCDYVSFDPRLPGEMQMCIESVPADPVLQAEITEAVSQFLAELDTMESGLRAKFMKEAA